MRRSWHTWMVFALCVSAVLAAMGWASHMVIRLDRAQTEALRQSAMEERVRLALWRMDSALTPLIALENARPYFAYTAFYPLERAYTRMYSEIQRDEVLVPSPLLSATPPNVLIHFQFAPSGEISSPQAPRGNMQDLAESGYVKHEQVEAAASRLAELGRLLPRERLLAALSKDALPAAPTSQPPLRAPEASQVSIRYGPQAPQGAMPGNSVSLQASPGQNLDLSSPARIVQQQAINNANEGAARYTNRAQALSQDNLIGNTVAQTPSHPVAQGEMKALWSGSTLVLARGVSVGGEGYLQGCWLDWAGIRRWLLGTLEDLLPGADLVPASGGGGEKGSRMLANLPVVLVPGPVAADEEPAVSPLWLSLAIAWACVALAAAVAARVLQRAVSLSERRGAFVSAVTHEMRTPLTTFRMYTEMLAEGMVPDEERRKKYLDVLSTEADRLSHLVENVLAYARLEGAAERRRAETVELGELVRRVEPRLSRRAALTGMRLVVDGPGAEEAADVDGRAVRADLSAVEQILMNLMDNACKYAAGAEDRRIHLVASAAGGRARLALRDHGPGIPPAGARRLFQAFSKSAHQAAESAPGIGLGLALSRRLARNMGGDLRLEPSDGDGRGACFVLSLPLEDRDQGLGRRSTDRRRRRRRRRGREE